MRLTFEDQGWEDYLYWQANDRQILRRLNELIRDAQISPFEGIGKTEPLKHQLSGWWSRRVNQKHRIVYQATGNAPMISECRDHWVVPGKPTG